MTKDTKSKGEMYIRATDVSGLRYKDKSFLGENPCPFFEHDLVWDGQAYTCSHCGQQFVSVESINNKIQKLLEDNHE